MTMSDDLFPFGLTSHVALVRLVQTDNPSRKLYPEYCDFGDFYASPTEVEPGRTFVEMTDRFNGLKDSYVYRRVPIDEVVICKQALRVKTPVTPTAIIEEINRSRKLALGARDVEFSNVDFGITDRAFSFTLKVLPTSYVYIGEVVFDVLPVVIDEIYLREEEGRLMLEESGNFMRLESI